MIGTSTCVGTRHRSDGGSDVSSEWIGRGEEVEHGAHQWTCDDEGIYHTNTERDSYDREEFDQSSFISFDDKSEDRVSYRNKRS